MSKGAARFFGLVHETSELGLEALDKLEAALPGEALRSGECEYWLAAARRMQERVGEMAVEGQVVESKRSYRE